MLKEVVLDWQFLFGADSCVGALPPDNGAHTIPEQIKSNSLKKGPCENRSSNVSRFWMDPHFSLEFEFKKSPVIECCCFWKLSKHLTESRTFWHPKWLKFLKTRPLFEKTYENGFKNVSKGTFQSGFQILKLFENWTKKVKFLAEASFIESK